MKLDDAKGHLSPGWDVLLMDDDGKQRTSVLTGGGEAPPHVISPDPSGYR